MELQSAEVKLWSIPELRAENWYWELRLNGELVAKSVKMEPASAREIAMWVAKSLGVEYREADDDEAYERHRDETRRAQEMYTEGLGPVTPKKKDLFDLIHESEPPPTDQ